MTAATVSIPPDGRPDADASVGTGSTRHDPREGTGAGVSPAMQHYGLLASPRTPFDADRRIEDWIASQIDLSLDLAPPPRPRNIWNQLITGLPGSRPTSRRRPAQGGPETAFADWSRFRVAYRRGITVVRLVDRALVKERHVRELTRDLIELIEAGNRRLLLNFRGVERVGSWIALAIDEVYRRAKAADGGELKLCGLSDALDAVLDLAGMTPGIERYADEDRALEAPWPQPTAPCALPVDILLALASGPGVPPIQGGAPASRSAAGKDTESTSHQRPAPAERTAGRGETGLWLIVHRGARQGRPVPVVGPRFLIGRQRDCQLRLSSPLVSKLHAAIERRDGRIILTDLGSTNGTVHNGRPLRGKETEIHDGDRIQIGPIVCTVATVARREGRGDVEEQVAEWLRGGDALPDLSRADALDTAVIPTEAPPPAHGEPEWGLKTEIIQDVLVVTPEVSELEMDSTIEALRAHLQALLAEALPRRVVLNLEYVAHLTGQAIGVILAHHLRLDRSGGGLRLCQARARIMAMLHQVRLTMLIECHPTLDEAVLSAWPGPDRRNPSEG